MAERQDFNISEMDWAKILRLPSVIFLIIINMMPLIGVFQFGWDVGFLMLIYWIETVVIGLFNIPKILTSGWGEPGFALRVFGNLFIVAFFTVHYGGFNFGHFMFLKQMFDLPSFTRDVWIAAGGLSLSHFFSLIVNWFGKAEYVGVAANEQMFKPYGRVIVMHVTIIFGGVFALSGGGVGALILLVLLKTVSDVVAHAVAHHWKDMKLFDP
jgi:hypothetical protein